MKTYRTFIQETHTDDYEEMPPTNPVAHGLGVSSLAIGIASLLPAMIPLLGAVFALPLAGIALLLGLAGLTVSLLDRKRSIAIPIAGVAVSATALVIIFAWVGIFCYISAEARKAEIKHKEELQLRISEEAARSAAMERQRQEAQAKLDQQQRDDEIRKAAVLAATVERERLANEKAVREAEAAKTAMKMAALKSAKEDLRLYQEKAGRRENLNRQVLKAAHLEVTKLVKDLADAEADAEQTMTKNGLSDADKTYVRGCVAGRIKHNPNLDPTKVHFNVTRPLSQGAVGVPEYSNRYFDPRTFGNSSNMKIEKIISSDELVIYPGYLAVKGLSTEGLKEGLQDGSRVDLTDITVAVHGTTTYTSNQGKEETAKRLLVVAFKKVTSWMNSGDSLKKWLTTIDQLAAAKAKVAQQIKALQDDERVYQDNVTRRMAEISKMTPNPIN